MTHKELKNFLAEKKCVISADWEWFEAIHGVQQKINIVLEGRVTPHDVIREIVELLDNDRCVIYELNVKWQKC